MYLNLTSDDLIYFRIVHKQSRIDLIYMINLYRSLFNIFIIMCSIYNFDSKTSSFINIGNSDTFL